MSKKITINVTQRDIQRGNPGSQRSCPIALAAHRHKALKTCYVGRYYIYDHVPMYFDIALPPQANKFVDQFDYGHETAPFKFTVKLPDGIET